MSETRIPTHSLRFIEREISEPVPAMGEGWSHLTKKKILQQMFETTSGKQFWEDVPLATE